MAADSQHKSNYVYVKPAGAPQRAGMFTLCTPPRLVQPNFAPEERYTNLYDTRVKLSIESSAR